MSKKHKNVSRVSNYIEHLKEITKLSDLLKV